MRLKKYINEAALPGLGITFVDIDETLVKTFARVNVVKDGEVVKSLSNAEFNAYKLKDGESFDFGEFRSAKLFFETSKPIEKMIAKIKAITLRADKKGSKVILLTARSDFDDKNTFLNTFRKMGFPIDLTYVERSGNRAKPGDKVSEVKKRIVLEYLSSGLYRRARIFDDFLDNCTYFLSIRDDIPESTLDKIRKNYNMPPELPNSEVIKFYAYQVQDNGGVKEIK